MKTNRELRAEARGIMRRGWFWRLVVVGTVLQFVFYAVNTVLGRSFSGMGIQTWTDFLMAKAQAIRSGMDLTVPSLHIAVEMVGASLFSSFIAYIFAAIAAFGFAGAALKATQNDDSRWFADSFGGFRRPLELAWLMALINLRVLLWSLLFLVPGLVAIYRYRQAWYVKNENPDWSAAQCLAKSACMMKGHKWRAFCFDCSYIGWLLLSWLVLSSAAGLMTFAGSETMLFAVLGSGLGLVAIWLLMYVVVYFLLGRAVFYRDMKDDVSVG